MNARYAALDAEHERRITSTLRKQAGNRVALARLLWGVPKNQRIAAMFLVAYLGYPTK